MALRPPLVLITGLAAGAFALLALAWSVSVSAAPLDASARTAWQQAIDMAGKGDSAGARAQVAAFPDAALEPVLDWLDYRRRATDAGFVAIAAFVAAHPDWPSLGTLRANAERQLGDADADIEAARGWLERHPPVTGDGALAWFRAMTLVGELDAQRKAVARAWRELDFSPDADRAFYDSFRKYLSKDDHLARLDRLLWERQIWAANRMLTRVEPGQATLAQARIALMRREAGVDGAVARVPDTLRDAPELWYERLRWRRKAGLDGSARLVLLDPPDTLVALPQWPRGDRWAQEAQILARRALSDGDISVAYRLAATHRLERGVEFAESEFLAGWIGHSLLRDHTGALTHFQRLYDNVRFPISRARGAFWAGEAAAASGAGDEARDWYGRAATHLTTFYGQAALDALGSPLPAVRLDAGPGAAARAAFEARDIVATVRRLGELDRPKITRLFLLSMMYRSDDADEMMLVAELATAAGQPLEGLRAAKRAHREDGALSPFAYPMVRLPAPLDAAPESEQAMLLALIRQESGFDRRAVSGSGARGMMQLLPSTARLVARKLGVPYAQDRLTSDPAFNIQLGSAYFADLLERFDGEPALALAGYNAGPNNVVRWIATYGDPREGDLPLHDWIESIPYAETRNYVQRVLEAMPVYRQLLGAPQQSTVTIPAL